MDFRNSVAKELPGVKLLGEDVAVSLKNNRYSNLLEGCMCPISTDIQNEKVTICFVTCRKNFSLKKFPKTTFFLGHLGPWV